MHQVLIYERMAGAQRASSLEETLADLSTCLTKRHQIKIRRDAVFADFVEFLKKPVSDNCKFEVKFVTDGWTEPASDTGGPRNQLFTLFFQECMQSERCMFESNDNALFPVDNAEALDGRWFFCLGRAIVLSLVQQGAGFPYMAKCCANKIVNRQCAEDENLTKLFQKITMAQVQAKSEEELKQLLGDNDIQLLLKGMRVVDDEMSMKTRLKNIVRLQNCPNAIKQLTEGLDTLGFLDNIRGYEDEFERFLVLTEGYFIDSVFMRKQLFDPLMNLKALSDGQVNVKEWAAMCLTSMNDDQALNLYEFITGMRSLPPGDCDIMIEFNVQNTSDKLPRAITCAWLLLLPLGNDSDKEFVRSFRTALDNRTEFGRI
ncbi:uncharacterized protein [Argopecten irradians]|uniref:uncharacterized protein n=1 Tax=Argopecten irradians TaxID=31199 RepID=UPI0037156ED2